MWIWYVFKGLNGNLSAIWNRYFNKKTQTGLIPVKWKVIVMIIIYHKIEAYILFKGLNSMFIVIEVYTSKSKYKYIEWSKI